MAGTEDRERATRPEDLSRFFMERANAGDVDGLVAPYEPAAVLASPPGQLSTGLESIRRFFERMVTGNPAFNGEPQPALRAGDLALTSTRFATDAVGPDGRPPTTNATVEVAHRQPDGTWLWIIDQPNSLG